MSNNFKVSKATKNVLTATSPNDFILNSDLNTFKIVKQGVLTSQTISGNPTTKSVAHGVSSTIPVVFGFIKYPDGKVYLPGSLQATTGTSFRRYWEVEADTTNIYFPVYKVVGSNFDVDISYYAFEAPVTGSGVTATNTGANIRITKSGYNASTETSLDNYTFHSNYDTLKYHASGTESLSVSSGVQSAETSVTHSLGYEPFFMVYLELDFSLGSGNWCQVPFNFSSMFGIITITARVDSSKLYFTATTTNGSGFGPMTLNFAYKIFRNDLGL